MTGKLGPEPTIHPTAVVHESVLGRYTEVGARASVTQCHLGDYSYVVHDSEMIDARIGKFCSIAAMTRINPGNHPMQRAAQAHFTYRASAYFDGEEDEADFFAWRRSQPVVLGHDVWVGHGAVILPGRSIGTGAVVAAGAVVTKSVESYTIVGGAPARLIRRRFPREISDRLHVLAWWDWQHEQLREALPAFRSLTVEAFLERYGG